MHVSEGSNKSMRKVALTSLAGTSIEWYDFFLYGTAAAVIFPKAFFPQDLPAMVLLQVLPARSSRMIWGLSGSQLPTD